MVNKIYLLTYYYSITFGFCSRDVARLLLS